MNGDSDMTPVQETVQEDLGSIIWDKLKSGSYGEALTEIKEEKHHQYLVNNSLDLVPVVLKALDEDGDARCEKCVADLLVYIATVANCKEVLIVFLEELELKRSEVYFRLLLQPMQTLLLRQATSNTRPTMFSWVFNTLYTHIATLDVPQNFNLEGKERKLLDFVPEVQALNKTLLSIINFYEAFYEKVLSGDLVWGGNVKNSRHYLAYFLLQLFHKPLAFLDVYCPEGEVEGSMYRTCSILAGMIARLLGNSFLLFDSVTWKRSKTVLAADEQSNGDAGSDVEDESDEKSDDLEDEEMREKLEENRKDEISQLSLACYFYCVLSQNMASEYMPCVHAHQYVFLNCLPLIVHLLEMKEDVIVHKGLMLSNDLLIKIPERTMTSECLDAKAHSSFPQLLIRVMTYCDNMELRKTALAIFRPYLRKFDSGGRRNLIKALLISVKHAGVLGLVIHELKENIAHCLNEEMDSNFCGRNLEELILLACTLSDGETTDLLDWSDSIMAALNLLIFVFVRDKGNKMCLKRLVPTVQEEFLERLHKGLDLSRAHYELKLREIGTDKKKGAETSVLVKGVPLPNMPPEQEKKVIQTALCAFDMMQCVLARAVQVVSEG